MLQTGEVESGAATQVEDHVAGAQSEQVDPDPAADAVHPLAGGAVVAGGQNAVTPQSDRSGPFRHRLTVCPYLWPMSTRNVGSVDLAVLGGGTAGIVAARTAAAFGARVVLIEQQRQPGGDCLFTGCVPSKALRSVAATVATARRAGRFGLAAPAGPVDFAAVMDHIRHAIRVIAPDDSIETMTKAGVEVVTGTGRFTAPDQILVGDRSIAFRQAMVATGSDPAVPDLPGLTDTAFLTSETIWDLDASPGRLLVLGGGSTGCELAQAFARLGSEVALLEPAGRLLPQEDPETSAALATALRADGVALVLGPSAARVETHAVVLEGGRSLPFDTLLVATGRRARTSGLGLEAVGVAVRDNGDVVVDDRLRTTHPLVWAAGDVTGHPRFTHLAGMHGAVVAANAVLGLRRRASDVPCPRVTYTSPEVGSIGVTDPNEVRAAGLRSVHYDHADLDRAVTEDATGGFTRLVLDRRGRVRGAVVVSPRAGETVAEATVAVQHGLTVGDLTAATHPYPGWSDGWWNAATGAYQARLARPPVWLALRGLRALRGRRIRTLSP